MYLQRSWVLLSAPVLRAGAGNVGPQQPRCAGGTRSGAGTSVFLCGRRQLVGLGKLLIWSRFDNQLRGPRNPPHPACTCHQDTMDLSQTALVSPPGTSPQFPYNPMHMTAHQFFSRGDIPESHLSAFESSSCPASDLVSEIKWLWGKGYTFQGHT